MTGEAPLDVGTNQVLPGNATNPFESVATNLGLSSSAFQALANELKNVSPNLVINSNTSMAGLRQVFSQLGLYAGGPASGVGTQPFVFSFQNLGAQFPGPAKFYTNDIASERWVLPVPPSDFEISVPNNQQTVTTISGFTYTHAGSIELDEVSFEGFLPFLDPAAPVPQFVPDYINFNNSGGAYGYKSPHDWVKEFVTAMRANQPLIFSVYASNNSGAAVTADNGVIIEPTAMSVSAFNWNMGVSVGGTRRDINYNITLKRWRRQSICISNYVNNPNAITIGGGLEGSSGPAGARKVTVTAKYNSLFKIAQKYLGNGHRWREIYNINENQRKRIDKSYNLYKIANPNPDKSLARFPMVPGMVLKIPRR